MTLRDRMTRLLRQALRLGLVAAAIALLVVLHDRIDGPIAVVEVSGELTAAERARATEVVASFLPAGFLTVPLEPLRARLADESWIDSASVRRRWPDALVIRIAPQVAVARWRDDALLSSRGEVIEPLELVGVDSLPRLSGAAGDEALVMEIHQMVAEILRPLAMEVAELERGPAGEVSLRTRGGLDIVLGADRHAKRMRRVATVLGAPLAARRTDIARIDARYDNGVAVAWRPLALNAAATARIDADASTSTTEVTGRPWQTPLQR